MEREVMRMERLLEKAAARESLSPARGQESPAAYECDKASAATELAAAARLVPSASARASYQELA